MNSNPQIILASGSPRRKQILEKTGLNFDVYPPDVAEVTKETAVETVIYNARLKAEAAMKEFPGSVIIAADTVVALDNIILGKPANLDEAHNMLKKLSDRSHSVYTAVCIGYNDIIEQFHEESKVSFKKLSTPEIENYFKICNPLDKAGAYNIDESGDLIIKNTDGSYENIMGLPVKSVLKRLKKSIFFK